MKQLKAIAEQVTNSARRASDAVGDAAREMGNSMPTLDEAKRGLGRALVFGGKALIDPQKVVGQLALTLGESLSSPEATDSWVAIVAADSGFLVVAVGDEAAVREQFDGLSSSGSPALLCKVVAAVRNSS